MLSRNTQQQQTTSSARSLSRPSRPRLSPQQRTYRIDTVVKPATAPVPPRTSGNTAPSAAPTADVDLADVNLADVDLADVDLADVDLADVDLADVLTTRTSRTVDRADVDNTDIDSVTRETAEAVF